MCMARKVAVAGVAALWSAAVIMAIVPTPRILEPWVHIDLNAATVLSLGIIFWPRTEHVNDAYEMGMSDGARAEREKNDHYPGSAELHVVRYTEGALRDAGR